MSSCQCNIPECVLCEGSLFDDLSSHQVCDIRGMITHRNYSPRDTIFKEGDPSELLVVVHTGHVKLSTRLEDGREQILRIAVPGQLMGFEVMDSRFYSYSAETVTGVSTCEIRCKDMLSVIESNPAVAVRVIRMLNEEAEGCRSLVRDLGIKNSTERLASFILSLMPVRGKRGAELLLPLSRREIAEMLGITPETVSRLMTRFRRDGVIEELPGRIRIADFPRLRALAGPGLTQAH